MLHKQFSKPAGKALAAGLMAAWLATGAIASGPEKSNDNAAQAHPVSTPTQQLDHYELGKLAQNYSRENDGIGIYINVAPGSKYTGEQIGDALVRKLAKEGIEARYTYSLAKAGLSSVDFFVEGIPYAGYGFDKIEEGYNLAVGHFKNLQDTNRIAAGLDNSVALTR